MPDAGCAGVEPGRRPPAAATPAWRCGLFTAPADPGREGRAPQRLGRGASRSAATTSRPRAPTTVYFVDGWEIRYDRVLVTFDHVTLTENPDTSPSDQSQVGALVAEVDGPGRSTCTRAARSPARAAVRRAGGPIAALHGQEQERRRSGAFDPTVRYAFGFDGRPGRPRRASTSTSTPPTSPTTRTMVDKGYTALFVGHRDLEGRRELRDHRRPTTSRSCRRRSTFHLGFKAPTSYINAQNPDNTGTADRRRGAASAACRSTRTRRTSRRSPSTSTTRSGRASSTTRRPTSTPSPPR